MGDVRPRMTPIAAFAFFNGILEVSHFAAIARITLASTEVTDSIHPAGGLEFTSLVPIAGLVNETSCASFKDEFITP